MPPNQHHTEYAPPVLRAPSPASSIGTTYGQDQTELSDSEEQLSHIDFEKKVQERLQLGVARQEEELANRDPLLIRAQKGSPEEKKLFEQVMISLQDAVQTLEDNELFERTLLRGSQAALEQQPTTSDIDKLMRGMMVTPQSTNNAFWQDVGHKRGRSDLTAGPWAMNTYEPRNEGTTGGLTSAVKPGKRSRNGSRRN